MKNLFLLLTAILAYSATSYGSAQNIKSKVDASASSSSSAAAKVSVAESSAIAAQAANASGQSKGSWRIIDKLGWIADNSNWHWYLLVRAENACPSEEEVKQSFEEKSSELFLSYFQIMVTYTKIHNPHYNVNASVKFIVGDKTFIHELDQECIQTLKYCSVKK